MSLSKFITVSLLSMHWSMSTRIDSSKYLRSSNASSTTKCMLPPLSIPKLSDLPFLQIVNNNSAISTKEKTQALQSVAHPILDAIVVFEGALILFTKASVPEILPSEVLRVSGVLILISYLWRMTYLQWNDNSEKRKLKLLKIQTINIQHNYYAHLYNYLHQIHRQGRNSSIWS